MKYAAMLLRVLFSCTIKVKPRNTAESVGHVQAKVWSRRTTVFVLCEFVTSVGSEVRRCCKVRRFRLRNRAHFTQRSMGELGDTLCNVYFGSEREERRPAIQTYNACVSAVIHQLSRAFRPLLTPFRSTPFLCHVIECR